jgi:ribosomal protein S3AE
LNLKETISERVKYSINAALFISDKVAIGEVSKKEYSEALDEILEIAIEEIMGDISNLITSNIDCLN